MGDSAKRVPIWQREPAAIVAVAGAAITIGVEYGLKVSSATQAAITTIIWLIAGGAIRNEVTPVRELQAYADAVEAERRDEFP